MLALMVGRFHALTCDQEAWVASLGRNPTVERIACALTSADHHGTRRNPLDVETRERIVAPVLAGTGKPFRVVRVADIPDDDAWPAHVARTVTEATGWPTAPAGTVVFTANRAVDALFARAGYTIVRRDDAGVTPHELVQRIVEGRPWRELAAPSTLAVYDAAGVPERLRQIFAERQRTDDGELAEHRDFASYGAQMDASLALKLADLVPWVVAGPGRIVDKGCGTGALLVELSRRFPRAHLVGVDLSREFLRRCDENTYAGQEVELLLGEAAGRQIADGGAATVIFSSVMHEIYSYSGYDLGQIDRALASAAAELQPGGRVLIRDGISPPPATWRLRLCTDAASAMWARFAAEFKHGAGAPHTVDGEWIVISAHLANEFLCKKDYVTNWHIEVHEEYGAHTLDGWRAALGRAGLAVREARAYCNAWIVAHRYRGQVELADESGRPIDFPATNAVIVGEKA